MRNLKFLLEVAEDLSQVDTDALLASFLTRLQTFFRADNACLHFTEPDELRDETLATALTSCPVRPTKSDVVPMRHGRGRPLGRDILGGRIDGRGLEEGA